MLGRTAICAIPREPARSSTSPALEKSSTRSGDLAEIHRHGAKWRGLRWYERPTWTDTEHGLRGIGRESILESTQPALQIACRPEWLSDRQVASAPVQPSMNGAEKRSTRPVSCSASSPVKLKVGPRIAHTSDKNWFCNSDQPTRNRYNSARTSKERSHGSWAVHPAELALTFAKSPSGSRKYAPVKASYATGGGRRRADDGQSKARLSGHMSATA